MRATSRGEWEKGNDMAEYTEEQAKELTAKTVAAGAWFQAQLEFWLNGQSTYFIKGLRDFGGLGLGEAKQAWDALPKAPTMLDAQAAQARDWGQAKIRELQEKLVTQSTEHQQNLNAMSDRLNDKIEGLEDEVRALRCLLRRYL